MKDRKQEQLHNAGFSLIELVIILAIMAILGGGLIAGIGIQYGASAKRAWGVTDSLLDQARVDALSRAKNNNDVYLEISKVDGKANIVLHVKNQISGVDETGTGTEKSGSTYEGPVGIEIRGYYGTGQNYTKDFSSLSYVTVTDSTPITIAYNRATGAFVSKDDKSGLNFWKAITFTESERTYVIYLAPSTGMHETARIE